MEQVERRGAHVRAVADRGARFAGEGAARERPAAAALLQRAVLGADEDRGRRVEDLAGDDALDWRVGQVPPARGAALRVVDDHLVWVSPSRQARTGRAGLLAPRVPLLCRLRLRLLACCGAPFGAASGRVRRGWGRGVARVPRQARLEIRDPGREGLVLTAERLDLLAQRLVLGGEIPLVWWHPTIETGSVANREHLTRTNALVVALWRKFFPTHRVRGSRWSSRGRGQGSLGT